MLSGQIVDGDTDRLRAIVPPGQTAFDRAVIHTRLCLDSPGGSFPEGLDLAAYLGETGISTHVAAQDSCLSACALAFLGGTQLGAEDGLTRNRSRSMHVTATLGFHAPQLNVPAGQFSETVVGQAFDVAIRASAEIFGSLEDPRINRGFALSVFDVAGQDFYFVDTPERARELGVTLTGTGPLPERIAVIVSAFSARQSFHPSDRQTTRTRTAAPVSSVTGYRACQTARAARGTGSTCPAQPPRVR
jgi:hypothetical protein